MFTFGVNERSVKLAAALEMTMLPMEIGGSGEAGAALVAAVDVLATVAALVSLMVAGALVSAEDATAFSRLMV